MNLRKPGKNTTDMMLLFLLRVQDNNVLPKWYEDTTGLCFDCLEDGDLHITSQHLNPPAAISIYGWGYLARHYCAYANGLPCLFRLRSPPFTLQLKLPHLCVKFWETNYKNALQQVLCKLWFICYLSSYSFVKTCFRNYVFTNHGGISAESITIAKSSLISEPLDMTVHRQVNVHHKHISVGSKFFAKLYETLFEINKPNPSCIG